MIGNAGTEFTSGSIQNWAFWNTLNSNTGVHIGANNNIGISVDTTGDTYVSNTLCILNSTDVIGTDCNFFLENVDGVGGRIGFN